MSTPPDRPHAIDFEVVQEDDVVASRKVSAIMGAAVVITVAAVVIGGLLLAAVRSSLSFKETGAAQVAPRQIDGIHQTPIDRERHGWEQREQQRRSLEGYRWISREQGVAAIPIERAMQIIVDRSTTTAGAP